VSALNVDAAFDHIVVQIAIGGVLLLAEVTRDAISRLDLTRGKQLYALIKSVSIDVVPEFRAASQPGPTAGSKARTNSG